MCGLQTRKAAQRFSWTADYGRCSSKTLTYFGCKLHSVVSLTGVIMSFLLTPASPYDNQPVVELLDSFSHHLKRLLGDKASNDAELQQLLKQSRALELLAPVKVNQPPVRSAAAQQQLNRLRLICETVNAQLQEPLHLSKHSAKSTQGLLTRVATKLTAHSVGMMVNAVLGRPGLHLAELAV
ncbi:MAG: transposase [Ktedonobacteraceae bacterium]